MHVDTSQKTQGSLRKSLRKAAHPQRIFASAGDCAAGEPSHGSQYKTPWSISVLRLQGLEHELKLDQTGITNHNPAWPIVVPRF
jgi:hypothetical protein